MSYKWTTFLTIQSTAIGNFDWSKKFKTQPIFKARKDFGLMIQGNITI